MRILGSARVVDDPDRFERLQRLVYEKYFYVGHPYADSYFEFGEWAGRRYFELVVDKMIGWDSRETTMPQVPETRASPISSPIGALAPRRAAEMAGDETSATRVLVVGESWIKHTVHMKGFDQFASVEYEEGGGDFLAALTQGGIDVVYLRAHEISLRFPVTAEELAQFDVVVLSDIGSNSFLLCDETFLHSQRSVNRLSLLADFVRGGGGLLMVGGYMSFSGIDGRARYGASPLADVLPVTMLDHDDRVEVPEGAVARLQALDHEMLGGLPEDWPMLLGYNRVAAKHDATVVARVGADPLLVTGVAGAGRAAAFASDCAPHWAPPEFVSWSHYAQLWTSIIGWLAGAAHNGFTAREAVTDFGR